MTASRTPNVEHRFFMYDPDDAGLVYYSSAKERDDAVMCLIDDCISAGDADVEFISIGEVTHVVTDVYDLVSIIP